MTNGINHGSSEPKKPVAEEVKAAGKEPGSKDAASSGKKAEPKSAAS